MNNKIYITLSADNNYAAHMGLVAQSVLENSVHPERIFFYFLDAGITPRNRDCIREIVEFHGATVEFISPDSTIYENIPKKRYGVAALYRLSLGDLLPSHVNRTIYLDCDVLAFDDVVKLWDLQLDKNIVGAVCNLGVQPVERLGIPKGDYFNSGVLLIDVEKWRLNNIGEEALMFMNKNMGQLVFPDQDALNCVLKGRWKNLPLRWNQQPASYSMYSKGKTESKLTLDDFRDAINNPGVVHYLGKNKPWDYMTFHPLKENYWGYRSRSPWNDMADKPCIYERIRKVFMFEKNIKHIIRRRATPRKIRNNGLVV